MKLYYFPGACSLADHIVLEWIGAPYETVRKHLALLNAHLEGREWLTNQRSIAEPYLFVMLRWAVRLQVGLVEFDHLSRFLDRMYADAGVRAAIVSEEGSG